MDKEKLDQLKQLFSDYCQSQIDLNDPAVGCDGDCESCPVNQAYNYIFGKDEDAAAFAEDTDDDDDDDDD